MLGGGHCPLPTVVARLRRAPASPRDGGAFIRPGPTSAIIPAVSETLLANVSLVDGSGGPPLGDAHVVIEDRHIADVRTGARPPGRFDLVVDAEGRTCVPGLIDVHVHLCWDGSRDPVEVNARDGR